MFGAGLGTGDETVLPALSVFVDRLRELSGGTDAVASLLSSPEDGSACKRLNLYLRWMVRRDAVDPGPWTRVSQKLLVVPLDTHLFRIAARIRLTTRKQADLKTALEVTRRFALLRPDDPVRYDFCLTRLGINPACRALAGWPFQRPPGRQVVVEDLGVVESEAEAFDLGGGRHANGGGIVPGPGCSVRARHEHSGHRVEAGVAVGVGIRVQLLEVQQLQVCLLPRFPAHRFFQGLSIVDKPSRAGQSRGEGCSAGPGQCRRRPR